MEWCCGGVGWIVVYVWIVECFAFYGWRGEWKVV